MPTQVVSYQWLLSQLPEPRPQPVAQEAESRCPASTGTAHTHGRMLLLYFAAVLAKIELYQSSKNPSELGGAKGTRTPDPLLAKQVLFQLSYSPARRRYKATRSACPVRWAAPAVQPRSAAARAAASQAQNLGPDQSGPRTRALTRTRAPIQVLNRPTPARDRQPSRQPSSRPPAPHSR
jgi:hypothetical protein